MLVNSGLFYRYASKLILKHNPKKIVPFIKKKFKNLIVINDYNLKLKNQIIINPSQLNSNIGKKNINLPIVDEQYKISNYLLQYNQLKRNKDILISFGASDRENYTKKVCEIIDDKKFSKFNFKILIGKYYKYEKSLKTTYLFKKGKVRLIKHKTQLAGIFKKTRMAIVSGSVISRELINFGIPSIVLSISDNQRFNVNYYKKNKIFNIFNKNELKKKNSIILNKLIWKNINFNFNSYLNIISHIQTDALNKIYYHITKSKIEKIYLYKTKINDFNFLYYLVNQKKNRKYSFNKKKISIYKHGKWFEKRLVKDGSNMFILKDQIGTRLGQIRLDQVKNKYYLDYSVDEFFQNQGLGKRMINLIKTKKNNNFPIYAKVLKENLPSNKIFKDCLLKEYKKYNLFKVC